MASVIEICQMALSHLGAKLINSLEDPCVEARQCRLLYEPARDQTLRDHPWSFAERRAQLSLATIPDGYGYDCAYYYPPDCHHAREIYQPAADQTPIEFKVASSRGVSGKVILTNQTEAVLIYTAKVSNPALLDPSFVVALSWRLAADLSFPLTKRRDVADAMLQVYTRYIASAGAADAMERYRQAPARFNTFLEARQ